MNLNKARLIASAVLAFLWASVCAQYPYIFRNDSLFHRLNLDEELCLQHIVGPEDTSLVVGTDTIPLNAVEYIDFRPADVPTLRFTTPDFPEADWVSDKENYIDATLDIDGADTFEDVSGLELSVKGRGNTTWTMAKKPIRLKFKKKTSILGFQKAKSYVLLSNYIDQSHMRNAIGLWLAKRLGMEFSNSVMPCNVYFNGHFKGLYLLTEKIGINASSVDIDENTGALFEASTEYDEPQKFRSNNFDLPIMIKDPDFTEICEADTTGPDAAERIRLWQEDFNKAERSVRFGRGASAFDIASAVDYYLVMNFVCNSEIGNPKSVYFYKRDLDPGSLYYFGPVWDLDVAFNIYTSSPDLTGYGPDNQLWNFRLLKILALLTDFQDLYKERLLEFANDIFPELLEWAEEYAEFIEPSARLDGLHWNEVEAIDGWTWRVPSFDTKKHVAEIMEWMCRRLNYMLEEAGLAQEVVMPPSRCEDLEEELPLAKGLRILSADDKVYTVELADGMEIHMNGDSIRVEHPDTPFCLEMDRVRRIDYAGISGTVLPDVTTSVERIRLSDGKLFVVPVAESTLEVFDLTGRRLLHRQISPTDTEIDYRRLKADYLIVNLNGRPLLKLRQQ